MIELIDPAQAIVGQEGIARQTRDQLLERGAVLGGKANLAGWIIRAEDLRQHLGREAGCHLPPIPQPQFRGQLPAVLQRHPHPVLGRDEQVILGEEAGKEQPMPLVIGDLLHQVPDQVLAFLGGVFAVAQLPGLSAQRPAQNALVRGQVTGGIRLIHPQGVKRLARAGLGQLAGLEYHLGEQVALVFF